MYTAIALHIEAALDPSEDPINRSFEHTYIHQGMLSLRKVESQWPTVHWTLQLFEWTLMLKNIPIPTFRLPFERSTPAQSIRDAEARKETESTTSSVPQPDIPTPDAVPSEPPGMLADYSFLEDFGNSDFLENLDMLGNAALI